MDGLLLDTENLYTVVQQQILNPFGKTFTWELKAKMMGTKASEGAAMLIAALDLQGLLSPEDFLLQRDEGMEAAFLKGVPLLPGAERLIRHLSAHGIPIAIATGSHRRHFLLKSSGHTELFSKFSVVVTGDMVARGKPHPEIFQTAASLLLPLPAHPGCCLVFEDAPLGVVAAIAAGMPVVMVPDITLDQAVLEGTGAAEVLSSLAEFDPTKFGLPPFLE
ncbi:MAG: hypothetical protein WDW38_010010 [Sanguina aurantia]